MRYMIYLKDKSTVHVSQKVGEEVMKAKMGKVPGVILNGACISTDFITIVKPIKAGWFPKDFVEQQERIELDSPDAIKFLTSASHE